MFAAFRRKLLDNIDHFGNGRWLCCVDSLLGQYPKIEIQWVEIVRVGSHPISVPRLITLPLKFSTETLLLLLCNVPGRRPASSKILFELLKNDDGPYYPIKNYRGLSPNYRGKRWAYAQSYKRSGQPPYNSTLRSQQMCLLPKQELLVLYGGPTSNYGRQLSLYFSICSA